MDTQDASQASLAATIEAGMEALGRGAWKEARSALEDAARADESPEILFGLGVALWWLGPAGVLVAPTKVRRRS